MLTVLLISALVVLLFVLGGENDRARTRRVVEIVDLDEADLPKPGRLHHR
jgi:hypothetical protein